MCGACHDTYIPSCQKASRWSQACSSSTVRPGVVGRLRACNTAQEMVASTHQGPLLHAVWMAPFIARKTVADLWSHKYANCIHALILRSKHAQEKLKGRELTQEPVKMLDGCPMLTAHGLCNDGPHLSCHVSFSADGVEKHTTEDPTYMVTPRIRKLSPIQLPLHTFPLLRQSQWTGKLQHSDRALQTRAISDFADGPFAATLRLSGNCDSDTVLPAGVSHAGNGPCSISFPNRLMVSIPCFSAHRLCRSVHCAENEPPIGIASDRRHIAPAHHTWLSSVKENCTSCVNSSCDKCQKADEAARPARSRSLQSR